MFIPFLVEGHTGKRSIELNPRHVIYLESDDAGEVERTKLHLTSGAALVVSLACPEVRKLLELNMKRYCDARKQKDSTC